MNHSAAAASSWSPAALCAVHRCNEDAIRWMQQGRYEQAGSMFPKALKALQQNVVQASSAALYDDGNNKMEDPSTRSCVSLEHVPVILSGNNSEDKNNQTAFFLSTQAYIFHHDDDDDDASGLDSSSSLPPDKSISILLSTILCNLALATHLRSLAGGAPHQPRLFQTALSMYDMAWRALLVGGADDDIISLQLAIANNKGHIYSCCYEREALHQCLVCVEHLLLTSSCAVVAAASASHPAAAAPLTVVNNDRRRSSSQNSSSSPAEEEEVEDYYCQYQLNLLLFGGGGATTQSAAAA